MAAILWVVLSRPQPDKPYQAGLACFQREDWDCCIANFEEVLALEANYRDTAQRLDECRQRRVVETKSQDVKDAWSEITRCEAAEDWDCLREKSYEIATKLDPQDQGTRKKFAEASLRQAQAVMDDDPDTALGLLREAQDLDVDPLPQGFQSTMDQLEGYLAGATAYAAGDWETTIAALTPYLEFRDSRDLVYDSYVRLCQAALKAGDLEESRKQADQALLIKPDGAEAVACGMGIADATYEALMQQAQGNLDQGQWQQAIEICKQALAVKSDDQQAQDCIGRANDGLYQEAAARGQNLLNKCQLNEAIAAFNEALAIKPGDSAAQAGIAQASSLQQPVTKRLANSYDDWRGTQGYNGWTYLAQVGGAVQEIGSDGSIYWWDRGEGSRIQQDGQHPGRSMEAVRRWRSSVNGTVKVYLQYRLQNGRGNTLLTLRQDGRTVWSQNVVSTSVLSDQMTLAVSAGTNLDLVVNSNGSQTDDLTLLRMTIDQQVSQCTPQ